MARFPICCSSPGCTTPDWHRRAVLRAAMGAPVALAAAALPPPAGAQGFAPVVVTIRDAETETLLRTFANPLFRASGVDPASVRMILIRDDALNAFVSTGNRLFVNTGIISKADEALELIGVLAHEAGHIRGGHLARLPELMREFSEYRMLMFGALMVLMMIWRPQGLLPMQRPHLELKP